MSRMTRERALAIGLDPDHQVRIGRDDLAAAVRVLAAELDRCDAARPAAERAALLAERAAG